MSALSLASTTALLACGDDDSGRSCHNAACGEPFRVRLRGAALEEGTRVEVEVGGQTATVNCSAAPEPRHGGPCGPSEKTDDYFVRGEIWNTDGVFLNVTVQEIGSNDGPNEARVVIFPESASEPVFDETFENIDYGEGYEINGPGCGLCYGPVVFEREIPATSMPAGDGGI